MKRSLLLTAALALVGLSSVCGSLWAAPIEIKLLSRWAEDTGRSLLFRTTIDEFNAKNKDIKIVGEYISDEPAYLDKLRTSFATGNQYDIYWGYGGAREIEYAKSGLLVDFDPINKANPKWSAKFVPGLDDKWRYPGLKGVFGVPMEMYAISLFYNEEIFKANGLKPPVTIADFEKVSDALLKKGIIPLALGEKDTWRGGHFFNNLIMKTFGAAGVDALADRSMAYDSAQIKGIFARMADYNKRGYFGPNAISVDYNNEKALFHSGKSAMHMDGTWYLGEAAQQPIADSIGAVPFPYVNEKFKASWFGAGAGWSVCKSKDKAREAAAIKVAMYITDKDFFVRAFIEDKGAIQPVKINEADLKGAVVSSISKKVIPLIGAAKELRDDVQTYDPLPSMLDTARTAIQGLFAGKSPDAVSAEIVGEIKARAQ